MVAKRLGDLDKADMRNSPSKIATNIPAIGCIAVAALLQLKF